MELKERLESKMIPEPNTGCWLWTGSINEWGYGTFSLKSKNNLAHRVSFEVYKGEIPQGLLVLHTCDQPSCVNPNHLWLGTDMDNTKDMRKKNRAGYEKLTSVQVQVIREACLAGYPQKDIGKYFRITQSNVSRIHLKKSWKNLNT